MKMKWYTPKPQSGNPRPATSGHARPRHLKVSASVDFNSSYDDPDHRANGFDPGSCNEDIPDTGEQRVLFGRIAPNWRIDIQIVIRIERDDDGCYIVSDDEFAVYGDGGTESQAIRNYVESLIEYYELLSAMPREDERTMALFRRLQNYLKKVAD